MEAIIQYGCNYTVWKQSMSLDDDTEVCKLLASDEAKQSLIPAKPDRLPTSSKHFIDRRSCNTTQYAILLVCAIVLVREADVFQSNLVVQVVVDCHMCDSWRDFQYEYIFGC